MVKKAKKKGWDWETLWDGKEAKEASVKHRNDKEKEGLNNILCDLAPHFEGKPGYYLTLGSPHKLSFGVAVVIRLEEVGEVSVTFRYKRWNLGQRGPCEGVRVRGNGNPSLSRQYGFDFETMRMTPGAIEKLVKAVRGHLEGIKKQEQRRAAETSAVQSHGQEAVRVLTAAGYEVKLKGASRGVLGQERLRLEVAGVVVLTLHSDGRIVSVGNAYESVPIRATNENIVEVVKAIAALQAVMDA